MFYFMRILRGKQTVTKCCELFKRNIHVSAVINNKHFDSNIDIDTINEDDREYQQLVEKSFNASVNHNCFIIHPYVKWGPKKVKDTSPEQQLQEAESLIRTLASWTVYDKLAISLESLDKKSLFGTGNLEKLRTRIRGDHRITAVFINTSVLKNVQIEELEKQFRVPIYDRYNIVIQILRLHAASKHAKLQVALAEIPYLRSRVITQNLGRNLDIRRQMLQEREMKIKKAIKSLRTQRELHRNRRRQLEYPVIAVVGYTNCGKTSLIKALTKEKSLQPKNQFFATLDVTLHGGILPSNLEVLYVDTVGFISNIPTNLIECFVATLEDAMYADVILHVEDLSNEDRIFQRNHVLSTLENLSEKTNAKELLQKIVTVGNKCDITNKMQEDILQVSAVTEMGIDALRHTLEKAVLNNTGRVTLTVRAPSGGDEMKWLFKNSAVMSVIEDKKNCQYQNIKIVITQAKLQQFKHIFIKK